MKFLKSSLIFSILLFLFLFEKIDYTIHSYAIDNMYKNDNTYNIINYLGYIEIDRLNIKREIVRGINDINLLSHVALDDRCKSLNCNNIILAGHSIKNIFGPLINIENNDIIKLVSNNKIYYYQVVDISIVDKNKLDAIDNSELILITCYDFNKRLIVKAKKK